MCYKDNICGAMCQKELCILILFMLLATFEKNGSI